jgi:hypothetical protein
MKAEAVIKEEKQFKPIILRITLETKSEFDAIYGIANYSSFLAAKLKSNDQRIDEGTTDKMLYELFKVLDNLKKQTL